MDWFWVQFGYNLALGTVVILALGIGAPLRYNKSRGVFPGTFNEPRICGSFVAMARLIQVTDDAEAILIFAVFLSTERRHTMNGTGRGRGTKVLLFGSHFYDSLMWAS